MLWVDKYKPKKLLEWIGESSIKSQVKSYFTNMLYGTPIVKCLVLDGSPGNGKTSIIYAIAKEMNLNVIEINASDKRNKDSIETVKQLAYLHNERPNVVLFDEADGLNKTAWKEILDFIENPPCPVVFTANDIDKIDWKVLKKSLPITISYPPASVVADRLREIIYRKGIKTITDSDICRIATECTNIRSAIYTLQQFSTGKMDKIEPLDTQFTLKEKMRKLFKGETTYITNSEHYKIIEWGLANHIDLEQLSNLSMLQSLGKRTSGMQDLVRNFGYCIRGNIDKIREPVPKWKKQYNKDKKTIKKLNKNNRRLSKKITSATKDSEKERDEIKDVEKNLNIRIPNRKLEEFF